MRINFVELEHDKAYPKHSGRASRKRWFASKAKKHDLVVIKACSRMRRTLAAMAKDNGWKDLGWVWYNIRNNPLRINNDPQCKAYVFGDHKPFGHILSDFHTNDWRKDVERLLRAL